MRQKSVIFLSILLILMLQSGPAFCESASKVTHALAMSGEPKYPAGFEHFEWVNPSAPKGGRIKLSAIGTYDSFNPFIVRGVSATGIGLLYDTLTAQSFDEPFSQYGLLAEKIELSNDRSWVIYHMNSKARFHDGKPVTAHDVVFSFNLLIEKGDPLWGKYWADVQKVEALDDLRVKFYLGDKINPELPLIIGQLSVLPKHYWEKRDFSKPSLDIPVGSGPYKISSFDTGRTITYVRDSDYWGINHPVNRGRYNFDIIEYDYYRDPTVALFAFTAGEYDFRQENIAKSWATAYTSAAFKDGYAVKEEINNDVNMGMQCFVFNTRRSVFKDRLVREALAYAFDFEWTNKNIFYNQYTRNTSFFSNSELASQGLPSSEELKILEPLRDQLPSEVFTKEYLPPKTDGTGNIRSNIRKAMGLLKKAGWVIKGGKLIHNQTGELFQFEMLLHDANDERWVLPFKKNLSRLGINMEIRQVDTAQFINRRSDFDYDMFTHVYAQTESPGNEQREFWGSSAADIKGARNYAGIKKPAIDQLIEQVISAPTREDLVIRCRALDRALLWGHYVIPHWHLPKYRVAYWNKFSKPEISPRYSLDILSWWVDSGKDEKLSQYKSKMKKSTK